MKKQTISSSRVLLEDGTYKGTLSGYQVDVTTPASMPVHKTHKITRSFLVADGIRGTVDCTVIVVCGTARIEY